jgi:hypothetical protein
MLALVVQVSLRAHGRSRYSLSAPQDADSCDTEVAGMSAHKVKQLVTQVFVELGANTVFDLKKTLFLDKGKCMAVAYRTDDLSAVWCLNDEIVEFRRDGHIVRTIKLLNEETPSSDAA